MIEYLLDTDTISLLQEKHPNVVRRVTETPTEMLAITVITVEEQLSGWYTYLRQARSVRHQASAYENLAKVASFLGGHAIVTLSESAIVQVKQLGKLKLVCGQWTSASLPSHSKSTPPWSLAICVTSKLFPVCGARTGTSDHIRTLMSALSFPREKIRMPLMNRIRSWWMLAVVAGASCVWWTALRADDEATAAPPPSQVAELLARVEKLERRVEALEGRQQASREIDILIAPAGGWLTAPQAETKPGLSHGVLILPPRDERPAGGVFLPRQLIRSKLE